MLCVCVCVCACVRGLFSPICQISTTLCADNHAVCVFVCVRACVCLFSPICQISTTLCAISVVSIYPTFEDPFSSFATNRNSDIAEVLTS